MNHKLNRASPTPLQPGTLYPILKVLWLSLNLRVMGIDREDDKDLPNFFRLAEIGLGLGDGHGRGTRQRRDPNEQTWPEERINRTAGAGEGLAS